MDGAFFASGTIRPAGFSLKRWLGLWAIAEIVAFLIAVKLLGLGATVLLMFVTSMVGVVVLRRVGLGAAQQLRAQMVPGRAAQGSFVDGSLSALGAILLILPGFVSDVVGLVLATPSLRQRLASRFVTSAPAPTTVRRRGEPDVIDLGPDDWRVVERTRD